MSSRVTVPSYLAYWGKARPGIDSMAQYHLLVFHSLDVAATERLFLQRHGRLLEWLAAQAGLGAAAMLDWLTFLLALHDLGKFATRHALAGHLGGRTGHSRVARRSLATRRYRAARISGTGRSARGAYRRHQIPRDGEKSITLATVDLSGMLDVIDPALFASALLRGVGRGKAFGCGLLLVRRARPAGIL